MSSPTIAVHINDAINWADSLTYAPANLRALAEAAREHRDCLNIPHDATLPNQPEPSN